jgi:pimeloyl-ACP methyl ester carboxylesterase
MHTGQSQYALQDGFWNVFEQGSGPPIVFLHNGGGTLWNWAHQLEHFSSTHRVIAPDLPGFGRSHRPSVPLMLDDYVQALSELLKALDCRKPILVGNCIGSSIALEFGLRHPQKISALALFNICGGLPMIHPQLQFWSSLRPSTTWGRKVHRAILDSAGHPKLQPFGVSFLYANDQPQLHPMLLQFTQQQNMVPSLRASLYWLVMGLDSFSIFSERRERPAFFPPVLLGWGAQNQTLSPSWASFIADWLTPQHFHLIENAGHMPMYERPDHVNKLLEDFFKTINL